MDPATIGLLISIGPTVLDILFGHGHASASIDEQGCIKEVSGDQNYRSENMYGYGLEGYGYRYPRRRRKLTVQTYYPDELQPQLIRAAVFNRAVARQNPWIKHLHDTGVYDQIRALLQNARKSYNIQNPEKRKKSVEQHLTKLEAQLQILKSKAQAQQLAPEFSRRYPQLQYDALIKEKMKQLDDEIKRLRASLPAQQQLALTPKIRAGSGSRV
jgi:hypothetical protein